MAAVYEAYNVDIGKRVAIKLLATHLAGSHTVVERFLREARAVSKINSPHICDVFDAGHQDGAPYLVLELLEGESLYDTMVRDRQMSVEVTLTIILQICRGLAKAHEVSIVHRDLKPENIYLTRDQDGLLLIKILDFGLAKFYDPIDTAAGPKARLTREGAVFGTPAYMSPEQVRGQAAADTRADLWALACITYECFTGTTVWSTEDGVAMTFAQIATSPLPSPARYRPDLPVSFLQWFRRALDRDISKRFQTVGEFADSLAAAFGYHASAGGLDISLIKQLARLAAGDPESVTMKRLGMHPAPPSSGGAPQGQASSDSIPVALSSSPSLTAGEPPAATPSAARSLSSSGGEAPGSGANALADGEAADLEVPPEAVRLSRMSTSTKVALLALLCTVGVVVYLELNREPPPGPPPPVLRMGDKARQLAMGSKPMASKSAFRLVAKHPWLPRLREAQVLIAQDELDRALRIITRAAENHRHGMLTNLQEQLQVAKEAADNKSLCQVTGYSRPRRYDLLSADSKAVDGGAPFIVRGIRSAMMAWTDSKDGSWHAYAVPLDEHLRNVALPVDITPEAKRAKTPVLLPMAERYLSVYVDTGYGSDQGVFLRWLGADAVITASPESASAHKEGVNHASAGKRGGGGILVSWTSQVDSDSSDLFFRRFDDHGRPEAAPVRLTDYLNRGPVRSSVGKMALVESGDKIHLAYELVRPPVKQIRYQVVPADTPPPGLPEVEPGAAAEELVISPEDMRARGPSLGCTKAGCFVAWFSANEPGASVAFIDPAGKMVWHKIFSASGTHPTVAVAPAGDVRLAWFEGRGVMTAALDRKGVGPPTRIARVQGDQPSPSLAPGAKRGEWYIAWLDFEAGHREPYAARIQCQL